MDEALERWTFEVEEGHWWYRGRRLVLAAVLDRLALPAGARIIDAGCGSGRNMVDLARRGIVTGVELAPSSVDAAVARAVGDVRAGSLEQPLPFAAAAFDVAVALDVLEHVGDDARALRELARVVRPGGWLILTVPQYAWLWGEHDVLSHHHRRYTRSVLVARAVAAGWSAQRLTAFNAALLAPIAAARLVQRLRRRAEPASDLGRTPGGAVNAALERVLAAEAAWIGRGRDLPAGVSLLAVLRRDATFVDPGDRVRGGHPHLEESQMNEVHEDNDTPTATDDDVTRMDADTEQDANPGAAVDSQGVGSNPTDPTDTDENNDPKSGGTPVHRAPTEDSPAS